MMRPRFEDPIDTAKDMMDNNITVFEHEYYFSASKQYLLGLDIPEYTYIAENMVSVKDWDEYADFAKHYIHGSGTHAFSMGSLTSADLETAPMDQWWKSSESVPETTSNYKSYLSRRNWILNEVGKKYITLINIFFPRSLG